MYPSTMILIVVGICIGQCLGQQSQGNNTEPMAIFNSFDTNKDGFITNLEINQEMAKYDDNGNGKVSRHEYTEFVCRTNPSAYHFSHFMYDALDFNHDHALDVPDYNMFFAKMDANGDGQGTFAEFMTASQQAFQNYAQNEMHHEVHAHGHSSCH